MTSEANNTLPPARSETRTDLAFVSGARASDGLRLTVFAGFLIVGAFFGGLVVWASLAPLESAAIAQGTVSVDSNRKTIQHLEGGIVSAVLVRDGDVVEAGQTLVRLDVTRPKATLELLRGRRVASLSLEARLASEQAGRDEIAFPKVLLERLDDPKVAEAIEGQNNIFRVRKEALDVQVAIQSQRIAQLSEEIRGLEGQIKAESRQLKLIASELKDVADLVTKGLARRTRLLALQRQSAEIEGSRSQNQARIARTRQAIGETKLRVTDLRTAVVNQAVEQLRDVQSELFDLSERIAAAEDVLNRTSIIAPLAGTIVGLQVHTSGGVIAPGEPLLNIVPSGDRLIVEARINPSDIDVVRPGLEAQVRLTPFSTRSTAPVAGRVTSVSADRLTDQRTGQAYYLARIEMIEDPAAQLDGGALYPGMPAEVMIVTGARTAMGYILKPITTSLNRAFRED